MLSIFLYFLHLFHGWVKLIIDIDGFTFEAGDSYLAIFVLSLKYDVTSVEISLWRNFVCSFVYTWGLPPDALLHYLWNILFKYTTEKRRVPAAWIFMPEIDIHIFSWNIDGRHFSNVELCVKKTEIKFRALIFRN